MKYKRQKHPLFENDVKEFITKKKITKFSFEKELQRTKQDCPNLQK